MTTAFESLLKNEIKNVERDLLREVDERRLSAHDVQDILALFPDLHVPGLITLLALGAQTSKKRRTTPFPLTKRDIADALAHLSAKDESTKQAARLLLTGQFFGDMADALATIFHVVPGLPVDLAKDVLTRPDLPRKLVLAIRRDLRNTPATVDSVVTDLRTDGTLNSQHKILSQTMGVLYHLSTAQQIAMTLHTLLGNESVRLAIIVFAKSKGVTITQRDLDHVRKAIDPQAPNLGELLGPGYQHLRQRFGTDRAMAILKESVV